MHIPPLGPPYTEQEVQWHPTDDPDAPWGAIVNGQGWTLIDQRCLIRDQDDRRLPRVLLVDNQVVGAVTSWPKCWWQDNPDFRQKKTILPMNSYHFSLGDSGRGPIGFCARINAKTEQEAVQKLREELETLGREVEVCAYDHPQSDEYVTVYFNPDKITVKDIDEVEALPEDDE